eukprot:11202163-Lingulodinium_polyedra.AAC.1
MRGPRARGQTGSTRLKRGCDRNCASNESPKRGPTVRFQTRGKKRTWLETRCRLCTRAPGDGWDR